MKTQRENNTQQVIKYLTSLGIEVLTVVAIENTKAIVTIRKPVTAICNLNSRYPSKNHHVAKKHIVKFAITKEHEIGIGYVVGDSRTGTLVLKNVVPPLMYEVKPRMKIKPKRILL